MTWLIFADFCPLVTKFEKQYGKQFLSTPATNSN